MKKPAVDKFIGCNAKYKFKCQCERDGWQGQCTSPAVQCAIDSDKNFINQIKLAI